MKLQGKGQFILSVFRISHQTDLLKDLWGKNDILRFPACKELVEELKDFGCSDFEPFASRIEN
jgi:hypothetical protein